MCGVYHSLHTQVAKLSSNKKEAAKQMLAQYDAVLLFLKSHGALLNAVKAEMLLEEDDFVRYAGCGRLAYQWEGSPPLRLSTESM